MWIIKNIIIKFYHIIYINYIIHYSEVMNDL